MNNKERQADRAKHVEKIIRNAWISLETHLEYTYKKTSEGRKFHRETIKEYCDIINNAIKLW